jgi:hypothetical protein
MKKLVAVVLGTCLVCSFSLAALAEGPASVGKLIQEKSSESKSTKECKKEGKKADKKKEEHKTDSNH